MYLPDEEQILVPGGGLRGGMVPLEGVVMPSGILEGWKPFVSNEINGGGCQVVPEHFRGLGRSRTGGVLPCFLISCLTEVKLMRSIGMHWICGNE